VIIYAALALVFYLSGKDFSHRGKASEGLVSPELSDRNQRIRDLEERFRDLERSED
jgi:hypothetical protein